MKIINPKKSQKNNKIDLNNNFQKIQRFDINDVMAFHRKIVDRLPEKF